MNRRDFIKSAAASAACASASIAVPSSLSAANEAEKAGVGTKLPVGFVELDVASWSQPKRAK